MLSAPTSMVANLVDLSNEVRAYLEHVVPSTVGVAQGMHTAVGDAVSVPPYTEVCRSQGCPLSDLALRESNWANRSRKDCRTELIQASVSYLVFFESIG